MVRVFFAAAALILLVAVGWRFVESGRFDAWLTPTRVITKQIEFDNGTVRVVQPPPPASAPAERSTAIGSARKCKDGNKVIYTDVPCPKGAKEHAIGGTVTVLDGPAVPKPSKAAPRAPSEGRRATLLEALDESGNQNLREKRIERAINQ